MKSLYGETIRKEIEEKIACKSECWMMTEYDERVKEYWIISNGNFIVEMIDDVGLEDEVKNSMLHLFPSAVSYCRIAKELRTLSYTQIMDFIQILLYYEDTDSMYIENKHWDKLNKPGLVGNNLLQGKMIKKTVESSMDCL